METICIRDTPFYTYPKINYLKVLRAQKKPKAGGSLNFRFFCYFILHKCLRIIGSVPLFIKDHFIWFVVECKFVIGVASLCVLTGIGDSF